MLTYTRQFPLFAALALLSGCFAGSGRLETRAFELEGFHSVHAERYVEVDVRRGDDFAVSVTADDNVWSELAVRVDGDALVVALSDAHPVYENVTVHAVVTMPALASVELSGGAYASLEGFDDVVAPALAVHGSGGSVVEGDARAEDLRLELSGGSRAVLAGGADALHVDASGGSIAELLEVEAGVADFSLSGGSHGVVTAMDRLDYHLSGSSHLEYAGDPELGTQETSGGSSVSRR